MFEKLIPTNPQREQEKFENRQMMFSKEQNTMASASNEDINEMMHQQEQKSGLLRWQQDLAEEVTLFKYKLMGYELIEDTYKLTSEPMCNKLFISQVVDPLCSAFLSRSFANSCLKPEMISSRLKRTFNNLAKSLIMKHKRYDISFQDFDDLDQEMKSFIVPAAFKAVNGWTKRTDNSTYKNVGYENIGQPNTKEQKGMFKLF